MDGNTHVDKKNTSKNWLESENRKQLIEAAEKAGKVFEREFKEQEEYELRTIAESVFASRYKYRH